MSALRAQIGRNIASARSLCGIPKGRFSRMCGIARNTLWRIESGRETPTLAMLEKMSEAVNAPIAALLAEDENFPITVLSLNRRFKFTRRQRQDIIDVLWDCSHRQIA